MKYTTLLLGPAILMALLATVIAPTDADAGQFLYNNGAGWRYSRPYPNPGQFYGQPPAQYYAPPRYYGRHPNDPGAAIAAALAGAALFLIPRAAEALANRLPPPPLPPSAYPPPPAPALPPVAEAPISVPAPPEIAPSEASPEMIYGPCQSNPKLNCMRPARMQ